MKNSSDTLAGLILQTVKIEIYFLNIEYNKSAFQQTCSLGLWRFGKAKWNFGNRQCCNDDTAFSTIYLAKSLDVTNREALRVTGFVF
jgi:hypothetical protein